MINNKIINYKTNFLVFLFSVCISSFLSVSVFAEWKSAPIIKEPQPPMTLNGVYSIPTNIEEDKAFAQFKFEKYSVITEANQTQKLQLELPLDLTGGQVFPIEFKLRSVQVNQKILLSRFGVATCRGKWKELACSVKFENIKIDEDKRSTYLYKKYGDTKKGNAIKNLATQFSTEPIGEFWTGL